MNENCERVGIGADDKNGVWIALNLLKEKEGGYQSLVVILVVVTIMLTRVMNTQM